MARTRNASRRHPPSRPRSIHTSRTFSLRAQRALNNGNVDSPGETETGQDDLESDSGAARRTPDLESDASAPSDVERLPIPPPPSSSRSKGKVSSKRPRPAKPRSKARKPAEAGPAGSAGLAHGLRSRGRGRKRRPPGNQMEESPCCKKQRQSSRRPDAKESVKKSPDWQDPGISYETWSDIFLYAASEGSVNNINTNWLIHAAATCHVFLEPALAALYRCPVIRTPQKARRLAELLKLPLEQTTINYRAKIQSLYLEIQTIPPGTIYGLIYPLPQLREVIVYTQLDQPPYRQLDKTVRWSYPEDLFRALLPSVPEDDGFEGKPCPTRLKSWEWSGRLIGGHVPTVKDLARIHNMPPFCHLTRLSFTNFQVPSLYKLLEKTSREDEAAIASELEDAEVIDTIGNAIAQLRSLGHLIFESSTVMTDRLLLQLPKNLLHLGLINCWEIKSEDLGPFLRSHGRCLRSLTLLHNQSLNLEFLVGLAEACPDLRELHINLSYYRHHETVDDGDPMYEQALSLHQVPTWPSALRLINIEHIRDWSAETAEMFLQSLIDQAGSLPLLRHLTVKTILDIPWQARATLRRKWGEKMDKTFLRRFEPPAHRPSLWQEASDPETAKKPAQAQENFAEPVTPSRRSGRLASQLTQGDAKARSRKWPRHPNQPLYRDLDTDDDGFDVSESEARDICASDGPGASSSSSRGSMAKPVVQGLCTTVSVQFDNQKVRELQYGMEDFQFSDQSSEDEWNGDREEEEDDVIVF